MQPKEGVKERKKKTNRGREDTVVGCLVFLVRIFDSILCELKQNIENSNKIKLIMLDLRKCISSPSYK
jgi:hypothetical protein